VKGNDSRVKRVCLRGEARGDGGLPLYTEMESGLVLIAERNFAFHQLAQFGGETKDQQIQRQDRQ
jgi:hypothetical protein